MLLPSGGGGSVGGGGGVGGGADEPFDEKKPKKQSGPGHATMIGAVVAGAAAVTGLRSAMTEDLAVRQALLSIGYPAAGSATDSARTSLYKTLATASQGTIFSEADSATALSAVSSVIGYSGNDPAKRQAALAKIEKLYPVILRFAEIAKMEGQGSLIDNAVAGVTTAHLLDIYDPKRLANVLDLSYKVSKLVHVSPQAEERVMQYAIPYATASGLSDEQAIETLAYLQRSGLPGTTAGTSFSAMLAGLSSSSLSRMNNVHREALQKLGLVSKDGKLLPGIAPGGKLSIEALISALGTYRKSHTAIETAALERAAFGIRGGRAAEQLSQPDALSRLQLLHTQINTIPGVLEVQKSLAQAPVQQFEQLLANANNILNTLTTATLPGLNGAERGFQNRECQPDRFQQLPEGQSARRRGRRLWP